MIRKCNYILVVFVDEMTDMYWWFHVQIVKCSMQGIDGILPLFIKVEVSIVTKLCLHASHTLYIPVQLTILDTGQALRRHTLCQCNSSLDEFQFNTLGRVHLTAFRPHDKCDVI